MSDRPVRIMVVTRNPVDPNQGGPGKVVLMLHTGIRQSKFKDQALVTSVVGEDARLLEDNAPFAPALAGSGSRFGALIKYLYHLSFYPSRVRAEAAYASWRTRILQLVEEQEPDIVHCHDYGAVYALPVGLSVPVVFTNHGKGSLYREYSAPYNPAFRTPLWRRYLQGIETKAIDRADVLVFPSESARQLLIDDFPDMAETILAKSRIIYTGIDDPAEGAASATVAPAGRSRLVVNVANHVPDKAIDVALRLFARLKREDDSLRFVNVGAHGPCTCDLQKLAAKLGISEAVEFRGVVEHSEVRDLVRQAALYLHTPMRVVFDLSVLEAMSYSTPVIASGARGNLEALGDSYPLVVPVGVSDLADRQLALIRDSDELMLLGQRLRARFVEHFTSKAWMSNYVALWKELAD